MKKKYAVLGIAAILLFLSFRYLLPLVLPFAAAYIFAKLVSPFIQWTTEKLHWNKKISSVLVVLISVAAVMGFLAYTCSTVISQLILLLKRLPVYEQMISRELEEISCRCDRMLELRVGTSYHYIETQTAKLYENIGTDWLPKLSGYVLVILKKSAAIAAGIFIFLLAVLLILFDDNFPRLHKSIRRLAKKLKKTGFAYMKSQGIIIFLIAVVNSIGLWIIGNEYAVLFGIGIAVFDAFPVVGSGIILIPWAVVKMVCADWFGAAVLVSVFVVATLLREVIEPKLFAKDLGLKPLYVLISVYVGIELFGVGGIILGPVALTFLQAVNEELADS
jgi:sporulation integral membrane protein YtvI